MRADAFGDRLVDAPRHRFLRDALHALVERRVDLQAAFFDGALAEKPF